MLANGQAGRPDGKWNRNIPLDHGRTSTAKRFRLPPSRASKGEMASQELTGGTVTCQPSKPHPEQVQCGTIEDGPSEFHGGTLEAIGDGRPR